MDEERNYTARPDEHAEATQHENADQSTGRRFIAGFAAVGLGLAAIVAVWSWQTSGSDHAGLKGNAESSQEAASMSTGNPTDLPEGSQSTGSDHRDHANLPTEQGNKDSGENKSGRPKGTGLAALGQDPHRLSNIWGGANGSGFAAPTETMQLSPGNPVDGGAVRTKTTSSSPAPQGVPDQQAPQTSQVIPQPQPDDKPQPNGGDDTGSGKPGLPTEWVPTQIPIPGPEKSHVIPAPGNTTPNIPQQSQTEPMPSNSQAPSETEATKNNQGTTGEGTTPSQSAPAPATDGGLARQGEVTDTTQE